jgi:hypothetical protein
MGSFTWMRLAVAAALGLSLTPAALAAQGHDPDWPCIQRKVPELSLGQIWNGPELPATAKDWAKDDDVAALVAEVSARRVPLAEAQGEVREFAKRLSPDETKERLPKLVLGLFDHMNQERAQVMSGIGRYAKKQLDMAAKLRAEAAAIDALRAKEGADLSEIELRTDRLTFDTRIFEERVQSLTYVCEVPTLIEQRLYALAKTIAEAMGKK